MRPYQESEISDKVVYRTFDQNIDELELVWHRDLEDRTVTVLEGNGWYFQLENELPVELTSGVTIFIPKMKYHRVIKGPSDLKIKIEE
jgi:quercetin dioxygenase-like cupin family protein